MAADVEILKKLEQELHTTLMPIGFMAICQGGSGYALDEDGYMIGLNLHNFALESIPAPLLQFEHLLGLSFFHNRLSEFPQELLRFTGLQKLSLSRNQLTSLPKDIMRLINLRYLDLTENQLRTLPEEITAFGLDIQWSGDDLFQQGIFLEDNPLEKPPVEIIKKGREAVITYFKDLHQPRVLNEVKVLLVGEGAAGKTSLVKRLIGQQFDTQESQTHGINIEHWNITPPPALIQTSDPSAKKQRDIKVHFWDFGGQEIMHATHQFFLSKRSVYILVVDSRREDKVEYWLKQIESFGGNSPVLVVLNKIDENPGFHLNYAFLQKKYPQIQGFYRLSCATGEGLTAFTTGLQEVLPKVELLHTTWPANWFNVKMHLEAMRENFITYEDYQALCKTEGITERTSQELLIDFLNDLGVILYFKEFALEGVQILEPRWLTSAVYTILTSRQLAENKGVLALKSLDDILRQHAESGYVYPREKYPYIIGIMKEFELCYAIDKKRVLIPDLLDVQEPAFEYDNAAALKYVFQYDFLPRSIMPRLIVKLHSDMKDHLCWRTGIVLEDLGFYATAVIKADYEAKRIYIDMIGSHQRRDYFATIRKTLKGLHGENVKCDERVCLPDNPEITVSYAHLLRLEQRGQETYLPEGADKEYKVKDLLGTMYIETRQQQDILRILREYRQELQSSIATLGEKFPQERPLDDEEFERFSQKIDTISHNIEQQLQKLDAERFEDIEQRIVRKFPYLRRLFEDARHEKYKKFLLTAEYFYKNLLKDVDIDGAASILEYAKIVDSILYECVATPIIDFHQPKDHRQWEGWSTIRDSSRKTIPGGLGSWAYLTNNSCREYEEWISKYYSHDQELCEFLSTRLEKYTERIRVLRNSAAHGTKSHGLQEARKIRDCLLVQTDKYHHTFMQWCLRILYYQENH